MTNTEILNFIIEAINEKIANEPDGNINTEYIQDYLFKHNIETRICDTCDKLMIEGYVVNDGDFHYCSDKCFLNDFSEEEIKEMLEESETNEGETYWTEWN